MACHAAVILIEVGCTFEFEAPYDTHAVVIVEPHISESGRVADASFSITPRTPSAVYLDSFGNACRRINLVAGAVELRFDARVTVADEPDPIDDAAFEITPADLPSEALLFVLPSRYCESDAMSDFARSLFDGMLPGWSRVQAISDWVHQAITFDYGTASPFRTAMDALNAGIGVCRDFTHLGITLCRALNIPARYVFGYLPDIDVPYTGPMDFSAWMEVFLGGRWHTFDPRNNQRRVGRVVIGRGRDAADVAMITSFGFMELKHMTVRAEPAPGAG